MEKRIYNASIMLSILKSLTNYSLDAANCGLIEIGDFIKPRKQFENWFVAKDELESYKVYKGYNALEENYKTCFNDALLGFYFYSYDEPIEGLCPTYTIKIDRLKYNAEIYVYYLG